MIKNKYLILVSCLVLLLLTSELIYAQIKDPAHWAYGVKKLPSPPGEGSGVRLYEVHLQATIDDGWHIYAQKQSPDAVAVPTKIVLAKVPGLALIGKPAEIGKKETYTIREAGVTNYEYAGKVDFVQKVKVTGDIKEIKGTITYQTCTHQMCLPETTITFTVPIPENTK